MTVLPTTLGIKPVHTWSGQLHSKDDWKASSHRVGDEKTQYDLEKIIMVHILRVLCLVVRANSGVNSCVKDKKRRELRKKSNPWFLSWKWSRCKGQNASPSPLLSSPVPCWKSVGLMKFPELFNHPTSSSVWAYWPLKRSGGRLPMYTVVCSQHYLISLGGKSGLVSTRAPSHMASVGDVPCFLEINFFGRTLINRSISLGLMVFMALYLTTATHRWTIVAPKANICKQQPPFVFHC